MAASTDVSLKTRFVGRFITFGGLLSRAMTLGARLAVYNDEGRILLIRHTYLPGWYLPGGGVDVGEAIEEAAERELREETGLRATAPLQLFGLYHNKTNSRRDHVALYLVPSYEMLATAFRPSREIAEIAFFDLAALPESTTRSTLARLQELAGEAPRALVW